MARVGIDRQEAGQDFPGGRACGNVRRGQREHRFAGAAGLQRQIVRRLQDVSLLRLLRFGRVDGGLPEILSGEELVGAGHVVFGQQFALHLEQAFRISHVAHQVAGDFRQLVVLAGEDLLPGFDDRVGLVPYIQVHGTVVCVHGGFHGIADVVGVLRVQAAYRVGGFRGGVLGGLAQVGHASDTARLWPHVPSGNGRRESANWSSHGWRTGSGRSRSGWRTAVWRRCCRSSDRHRP